MAPRTTRAKASKPTKTDLGDQDTADASQAKRLHRVDNEQQRLFVLPKTASNEGRIITLPNPATSVPSRYHFDPTVGLHEFTKVSAPKIAPHSWLIADDESKAEDQIAVGLRDPAEGQEQEETDIAKNSMSGGYVLEDASLFVATPIDPVFFLLTFFNDPSKAMFRMEDDYVDTLSESSEHLSKVLRQPTFRTLFLRRLGAVSQKQDLGDETVYKPDLALLITTLLGKARRMAQSGTWPTSLEDAFVAKQLEIPLTSIKHVNAQLPTPEESQASSESQTIEPDLTENEVKETDPAPVAQSATPEVATLMRLRVAFTYILSAYVPMGLRKTLKTGLMKDESIDFEPLDEHLEKVKAAKAEVQALRSISDNVSRKRDAEDDEALDAKAEKKRKKEEDEKRKKAESRASKDLKKVDVSGMKKMSSFFTKAPASKAAKPI